jgi:hypothetical protein
MPPTQPEISDKDESIQAPTLLWQRANSSLFWTLARWQLCKYEPAGKLSALLCGTAHVSKTKKASIT